MKLNYKPYKEANELMNDKRIMPVPGEQYKGYSISYRITEQMSEVWGFTVIISISKAGKTLNITRYIPRTDSKSYSFLTNESKTLIDFIEYQIEAARTSTATETDKIDFGSCDDDIDIPQTTTEVKTEKIDELHSWLYQKEK